MTPSQSVLVVASLLVGGSLWLPAVIEAQAPPLTATPTVTTSDDYVFRSGTGVLVFHVRPDRVEDFEAIVARLADGLDAATDPVRRQQKTGWRMFRSADAPASAAIYVLLVDPVVVGADYDPVRMLTELAPAESPALYERLKAAVARVERMGLTRIR
jgi:hypothetical protein